MDQSVFEELIQEQLPELAERLRDPSALASLSLSWFLTLFLSIMPLESAVHVVDCFFYDGIKVVFQLGLAVLEANARALCSSRDDGQALVLLSRCAWLRAVQGEVGRGYAWRLLPLSHLPPGVPRWHRRPVWRGGCLPSLFSAKWESS